jgi:cyanophycinase
VATVVLGSAAAGRGAAPPARRPRTPEGALVIVGGGSLPDVVRDRFLDLAGGRGKARLVVVPTASLLAHTTRVFRSLNYWKNQGVTSVTLLHTLDRKEADDPAFVKPLTEATAVWLAGGDQGVLLKAYHGTLVERELHKLLARGGVIGGTSAGASAMSAVMIVGGNPLAQVRRGFGFLPEVVIDQHFQNRNRLQRLLGVLARHPTCLGLGIDEETAVVVQGNRGTVVGRADVRLCLPSPAGRPPSVRVLKSGQMIDLRNVLLTVRAQPEAPRRAEAPAPRAGEEGTARTGHR